MCAAKKLRCMLIDSQYFTLLDGKEQEEITMAHPLTGTAGKPLISKETSDTRFVGRVIIELYEGPHIESDADGFALVISPAIGSGISQHELLKRIAAALPARVLINEKAGLGNI